jgi:hypothetical protein
MAHCFYAIVTGNNHANLAALALAHTNDLVVWIETAAAKEQRWLGGCQPGTRWQRDRFGRASPSNDGTGILARGVRRAVLTTQARAPSPSLSSTED